MNMWLIWPDEQRACLKPYETIQKLCQILIFLGFQLESSVFLFMNNKCKYFAAEKTDTILLRHVPIDFLNKRYHHKFRFFFLYLKKVVIR